MTPVWFTHYDLTWNYSLISICFVSVPCDRYPDLLQVSLITPNSSITEVNVGIICACLSTFPACVERHRPHTFGSLGSSLLSSIPSRLSKRSPGSSGHRHYVESSISTRKRSDDIVLEGSEYAKLASDGNPVSIQDDIENKIANHQSRSSSKASNMTQDDKVWPGHGKVLRESQPRYPVAMHLWCLPRRDIYERESVIRG